MGDRSGSSTRHPDDAVLIARQLDAMQHVDYLPNLVSCGYAAQWLDVPKETIAKWGVRYGAKHGPNQYDIDALALHKLRLG